MVDDVQTPAEPQTDATVGHEAQPSVPAVTTDENMVQADHPHAGIAEEGWSVPVPEPGAAAFAKIVLKRSGVETDIEFPLSSPAIAGRFDPTVGPIDVDLASLPEGAYVSRKHAKFTLEDGVWKIKDLGSSNGTWVLKDEFERVEEAELSDGQEFALGNARFVFHLSEGC